MLKARKALVKDETAPTLVRWQAAPAIAGEFERKLEAYVPRVGWRPLAVADLRDVESLGPVHMNPSAFTLRKYGVSRG